MPKQTKATKATKAPRRNTPAPPRQNAPRFRSPIGLPTDQFVVTQGFNNPVDYSRLAPHRNQQHEGIDFAPVGDARNLSDIPVVAVAAGVVESVRRQTGGYGNYVTLRFDDGRYGALYAHLDSVNVQPGQRLNEGDVIGTMGNTGNSRGRHLHFNVMDFHAGRGNYVYPNVVDPTPFLSGESSVIRLVNEQPVSAANPRSTKPGKPPVRFQTQVDDSPRQNDYNDYPPGMVGTNAPPVPIPDRYPPPSQWDLVREQLEIGTPPLFQQNETDNVQIGAYSPQSVAESAAAAPNALASGVAESVLDAIESRLPEGQEIEDYIQEKAPYVILAIVAVLLLLIGAARLVFNPSPLK